MNQTAVTGMVLSSAPVGEYDRRIVLLTKEQGKISAFARGARKPNSPLVAAVTPCSFGEFTLYIGRTSNTLQSAKIKNYFSELRSDVTAACYGFYFLEFTEYFTKEGNDEQEMLKLLYQTMKALVSERIPNALVRRIFELRALCINGIGPQVFQCTVCGSTQRQMIFSTKRGGLVCEECKGDVIDGVKLSKSALYTMQYVESTPIEKLYTFLVKDDVLRELKKVLERYMEVYVDKKFKSLEILQTMI